MLSKLIKRLQNVNSVFNIKLFFNRKRDKSLYAFLVNQKIAKINHGGI